MDAQGRVVATLWAAVIVWAVRLGAVYLGSWAGARAAGTPPEHRRKVWQGMVTQVLHPPLCPSLHAVKHVKVPSPPLPVH